VNIQELKEQELYNEKNALSIINFTPGNEPDPASHVHVLQTLERPVMLE
jgi:hypothetical protein